MTVRLLEYRTAPSAEGPWGEPVPSVLVYSAPAEWSAPEPWIRNEWKQSRVVEYARVEMHAGTDVPTDDRTVFAVSGGVPVLCCYDRTPYGFTWRDMSGRSMVAPDLWTELPSLTALPERNEL